MNTCPSLPHRVTDGSRITLCGWCPGSRELTRVLAAEGKTINHGMCDRCATRMHAELDALPTPKG